MRRVALFVVVLAGCGVTEPVTETPETESTIRVQGTVTTAAEGTAIWGAKVEAHKWSIGYQSIAATTLSDSQGRYSLSFARSSCFNSISASCGGFQRAANGDIRCTNEVQTIDFQLELAWEGRY